MALSTNAVTSAVPPTRPLKMSIQAIRLRLPAVDVGTPTPTFTQHEWEAIEVRFHGFENLPATRGEYVSSPEFMSVGHRWRLQLYPGGNDISDGGMVGIYLQNCSDESITAGCFVGVKNKYGFEKLYVQTIKNHKFDGKESDNVDNWGWGRPNFGKRTKIIPDLVEGSLIIVVRLKKSETPASTSTPFIAGNPLPNSILGKFMDEESSDIVFEVVGHGSAETTPKKSKVSTTFFAHRFIVQDWTPKFGESCKDSHNSAPVPVSDVKPDIFRHLLYYAYGGKIDESDLKENAKDILEAADKYGVVGLKLEAEAIIVTSSTITIDNAMDNLLYADSKNFALLKEAVMDFLVENVDEGIKKLSFDNFPGYLVKDLMTAFAMGRKDVNAGIDAKDFSTVRVSALRRMLHEKGLDIDGSRETMIARLEENS